MKRSEVLKQQIKELRSAYHTAREEEQESYRLALGTRLNQEDPEQALVLDMTRRRRALGKTQADIANAASITRGSISNIEAGRQHMSLRVYLKIQSSLDMWEAQS